MGNRLVTTASHARKAALGKSSSCNARTISSGWLCAHRGSALLLVPFAASRSVQYRHLCGGPLSVQAPWEPAVCGGMRFGREGPSPSSASSARRPDSSLAASGAQRSSCSSRDDSSTKRCARAFIVRGWR